MSQLWLEFYGTSVLLESERGDVLEALRRDFAYFNGQNRSAANVSFTLTLGTRPPAGRALFRARDYAVSDAGSVRAIRYADGASAVHDFRTERGSLWAAGPERLQELGYLAVLSRVGEALDRQGLHRVHALGFEHRGAAALVLLPEGGGKSTLALELLRASPVRFLSEDTPLVDRGGRVLAFPLRWGFRETADLAEIPGELVRPFRRLRHGPKRLVDVSFFADRVRAEAPLRWVIVGRRGAEDRLRPCGRARAAAALAAGLVAGVGVPQMSEYLLRPTDAASLAAIALSRARAALAMLSARLVSFELGREPKASARALLARLDEDAP